MASFQDKIGWKMMRKRENKNYHSVPFCSYLMCNRKSQNKIAKKLKKLKKYCCGFISSQNRLEKAENDRK